MRHGRLGAEGRGGSAESRPVDGRPRGAKPGL